MFINLTPHDINVIEHDGPNIFTIPASGQVARVSSTRTHLYTIAGIAIDRVEYGVVEGLPDPEPGVNLIVSGMVAVRCPERDDLLVPGELVRDQQGRVIGCKGLTRP